MTTCCAHTTSRRCSTLLIAAVTAVTIIADQVSKLLILQKFQPGEILPVIPEFFNLTLTFNPGAAFGLWTNLPPGWREFALGASIALALTVVIIFLRQPMYQTKLARISLSAILGGALGNIIDRLVYGSVVDFLDVYIGNSHWPAFNVADSAISLGVIVLVLLPQRKPSAESADVPQQQPSSSGE
jgi:signal peptidase II